MKKIQSLLLAFFLLFTAMSQNNGATLRNNGGKIEALKIAFLTNKMSLSPAEAQRFWPVYNKYTEDIRKTRLEAREKQQSEITIEEKILDIRKKYDTEFRKVISADKTNVFFRAEKEFGTYLQKEIMERRQQRIQRRKN